MAASVQAQQGHPLTGTWLGDWGGDDDRNFLTLILQWDGSTISGLANPGPGSTELQRINLDSADWSVTFETDLVDRNGDTVHIRARGTLSNIASMTRTLNGTWTSDSGSGDFSLTRQSGA
jgi:hypothetical protein